MVCNERVLLMEVDLKRFIVLFAPEDLVPAEANSQYGVCNSWDRSLIKYEFSRSQSDLRRSSSVASAKLEPLLAGTK